MGNGYDATIKAITKAVETLEARHSLRAEYCRVHLLQALSYATEDKRENEEAKNG